MNCLGTEAVVTVTPRLAAEFSPKGGWWWWNKLLTVLFPWILTKVINESQRRRSQRGWGAGAKALTPRPCAYLRQNLCFQQ